MVPSCSPDSQTVKKPPKPTTLMKTTLNSIKIHISSHPRFWLFIAFLWAQAFIISIARTRPPCFPDRSSTASISVRYVPIHDAAVSSNATVLPDQYTDECPSGRVYAYDLPSSFNRGLLVPNCTDLGPWNWECGIISNHGYGRAATELRRTLPEDLYKSWYHTNQFTLEVLFHHRILKHKCRTLDPELVTAFYIPFYVGLAVGKHL